ncbi:MAG: ATP-dependent DNA helicase [Halobacteriales archaeon]|nr:ATP-dependent DNA helicase [Halobacteriales archaeon]
MEPDQRYDDYFPKETPYPNQSEAMSRIGDAVDEGRDVVFEGACGTGKTLSALVPALEHARREDRTVVITTSVHQQMRQFVEEAREIKQIQDVSVAVFRGKSKMCHIDVGYEECQALRENTYDLVEAEGELDELGGESTTAEEEEQRAALEESIAALRENSCDHFHENLTRNNADFMRWLDADVREPDEVYDRAEGCGFCGYELLKESMDDVDLVICNYHHLLSPEIRDYFFGWLDANPDEVIAVFDEAHNLEDAAREHSSRTLGRETLERAELELAEEGEETDEEREVLAAFREALTYVTEGSLEFGEAERLGRDWQDVTVENDAERDDLTDAFFENLRYEEDETRRLVRSGVEIASRIDARYEREYKSGDADTRRDCAALSVFSFLDTYLKNADEEGYFPVAGVRRSDRESDESVDARAELYTCLPNEVTGPLFDSLHASVLMSATLRPFDVFSRVLGLDDPVELAYGMHFPEERRETFVADVPALFSSKRDDPNVTATIEGFLEDVIDHSAGNVLVFFPSFSEAERYHERLDTDAELLLDRVGESARSIRRSLEDDGRKAVLTYLWGTLTEGVDFPDDVARTAVVVGVGYPYLSDRKRAVENAYDDEFGDGWKYAVEAPTVRKTRQALGRVVRSPDDYGVRILADARYRDDKDMGRYGVRDAFPPEERDEFVNVDADKIKYAMYNFWQRVGDDSVSVD